MSRERKAFVVYIDLDPIPGAMHTQESAQNFLRNAIQERFSHYNPIVSLAPSELQPCNDPVLGTID